jgi:hypothetical protein
MGMSGLLVVNLTSSVCGECGKGCDPREKSHQTVLGYGVKPGTKGCGAAWDRVTSHYVGPDIERAIRKMRPDLEWEPVL